MAWLWLQWATALGTQETLALDQYKILPTRPAAYSVPQVASALSSSAYSVPQLAKGIFDAGQAVTLTAFLRWYKAVSVLSYHLNQGWEATELTTLALSMAQTQMEALGSLTF